MKPLLEFIHRELSAVTPRLYYEWAPEKLPDDPYPYAVWSIAGSDSPDFREDFILEVNAWGTEETVYELDDLTSAIDARLNRLQYIGEGFHVRLYRMSRAMVPDPNPILRRREIRYMAKTYLI